MLAKPDTCKGCSLYGDGQGFVEGKHPSGALVKLLGSHPDDEDEKAGMPFAGKVGQALKKDYLPILGLGMDEVARDNVLRCRQQLPGKRSKTNDYPTGKILSSAIDHCRQYDVESPEIKLILLLGDKAFGHFYPDLKVGEWVGHLLPARENK